MTPTTSLRTTDIQRFTAFWRYLEGGREYALQGYRMTVLTDAEGHQDLCFVLRAASGAKHYAPCEWPLTTLFAYLREIDSPTWVTICGSNALTGKDGIHAALSE